MTDYPKYEVVMRPDDDLASVIEIVEQLRPWLRPAVPDEIALVPPEGSGAAWFAAFRDSAGPVRASFGVARGLNDLEFEEICALADRDLIAELRIEIEEGELLSFTRWPGGRPVIMNRVDRRSLPALPTPPEQKPWGWQWQGEMVLESSWLRAWFQPLRGVSALHGSVTIEAATLDAAVQALETTAPVLWKGSRSRNMNFRWRGISVPEAYAGCHGTHADLRPYELREETSLICAGFRAGGARELVAAVVQARRELHSVVMGATIAGHHHAVLRFGVLRGRPFVEYWLEIGDINRRREFRHTFEEAIGRSILEKYS